jgi:methionyl-tRNA synthetase
VAELLLRCNEAGDIYKADYSGYYCVDCEEYKVAPSRVCSCCCLTPTIVACQSHLPSRSPWAARNKHQADQGAQV